MRDRTASRSYSPAGDEFRREHEHRRSWGLTRRHAERLRRSAGSDHGPHTPTAAENPPEGQSSPAPAPVAIPLDQAERPPARPGFPVGPNRSRHGEENPADQPGPAGKTPSRSAGPRRSRPAGQPPTARVGTPRPGPARRCRHRPATNTAPDFPEPNNRPRITPSKTRRDRGDPSRDRHFPTRAPPVETCTHFEIQR